MRLKEKTALIAGAGRNIGKAIALTFAREGANLILIAKERKERLSDVAKECEGYGIKTLALLADVSKHQEAERVVQEGLERFGKVDVLVNVVGIRPFNIAWEYSYEQWHEVFAANLHSTFYLTKTLVPAMIERKTRGSIIALGGMSTLTALNPRTAALVASKTGLYGLIKALALDLGPHGIRANLITPGTIESERANPEWYPAGTHQQMLTKTPLGRYGTPQEVANVALFLASEESSYITGDRVNCSGGLVV